MLFPITLNGTTYQFSSFSPFGYQTALTDSLESLADHLLRSTLATSVSSQSITAGTITLDVGPGKGFVPGMTVRLTNNADLSVYAIGTVASYSTGTGSLVVTRAGGSGAGTVTSWLIDEAAGVSVLPVGVVSGGAGVASDFRNGAVSKHTPSFGMEEVLTNFQSPIITLWDSAGSQFFPFGIPEWVIEGSLSFQVDVRVTSDPSRASQSGAKISIGPSSTTRATSAYVSVRHGYSAYCPTLGGGVMFAARVSSSAGGDSAHTSRIGLRGNGSSTYSDIFSSFGLGFEFRHTLYNEKTSPPTPAKQELFSVATVEGAKTSTFMAAVSDNQDWALSVEVNGSEVLFTAVDMSSGGALVYQNAADLLAAGVSSSSLSQVKQLARYVQPAAQFERNLQGTIDFSFSLRSMMMTKSLVRN